jgi:WD40 repeat protein
VAFSPDGKILAAASYNGWMRLWNVADLARPAQPHRSLHGPIGYGNESLAFSPDGKILAAASLDYKVWLWNMTDPAHPARFGQPLTGPPGPVGSIAFSPDRQTLAVGSDDNTAWLWNLDVDTVIQRICATTSNILTYAQWKQYLPQLPYSPPCAHPGRYGLLVP